MRLMNRLFIFLLIILCSRSYGQFPVVFVDPPEKTVCRGGTVTFVASISDTVPDPADYIYEFKWLLNNIEIPDSTRKYLVVKNITALDTGYYRCIVTDSIIPSRLDTSPPSHLRIRAQLHIDTLYRYNALGCPSDSNGQMKIKVSGGHPPYTYEWGGGSYHQLDTLGVGFSKGTYIITVTDSDTTHCISREFTIETLKLHKITFLMKPPDTVYLPNPMVTVTIPDTAVKHLDNWNWDFGDKTPKVPNINPCQHGYSNPGQFYVNLNFTDNIGGQLCDSTIIQPIIVKPIRLFIPNAITPGSGDDNGSLNIRQLDPTGKTPYGSNLDLSEVYLSNQMFIFNRQGKKVFEKTNYKSGDWDGGNLSAGVYYYILKCHGQFGDDVYRGAITIIRY
jgi:hypothetical protein